MRLLILLLFQLSLWAAVTVKNVATTSTQAVLSYTAPSSAACTVEVSESAAYSPVVHDVNAALFAGANLDSRTRSISNGVNRSFVVGQRTSGTAGDGKLYSRALQAVTLHYYRITCGGDEATGAFSTTNISLGNTVVEPPPFNANGFGNYAWPTIDWTDASKTYIDPMTGVLIKLAYQAPGRQSNSDWGTPTEYAFAYYVDPGSAWTDAANVLSKSTGGPFATYAGVASAPLFLATDGYEDGWSPNYAQAMDDIRLTLYGSGDDAAVENRKILACLSVDSQTCASAEIELTLPQTTPAAVTGPATYPEIQFNGWSVGRFLTRIETSMLSGTVNTSVSTVTYATGSLFDIGWKAGSKIYIAGSSGVCTNSLCTIVSVTNARQLVVSETVGTLSGAVYKSAAWGIRIRKKMATGSVSLNSSNARVRSWTPTAGLNAQTDFCSSLTTTVSYAADGATPITPVQGRLCIFQEPAVSAKSILVLLIDSTGETRVLSHFYNGNDTTSIPPGSFSPTDPLTVYANYWATGDYPNRSLWTYTYDAVNGKFKAYTGPNYLYSAWPTERVIQTDLTPGTSIEEQVAASIGTNPFYKSWMGSSATFVGIVGNYAVYSKGFGGQQDSPCFVIRVNLTTGLIAQIQDTMGGSTSTARWGGCHAIQAIGVGDWIMGNINMTAGYNATSYMHGPFQFQGISHVYKGGAWTTDTSLTPTDMNTCTPGNPYESAGATGSWCMKLRVTGEPCSAYPTASEKADYPCPWDANRSMPQTLQAGDTIWESSHANQEKMLVISKTSIGGGAFELEVMRRSACRGVQFYDEDNNNTHANGWNAAMSASGVCASGGGWWLNATSSTWYPEDPALSMQHNTFGSGATSNLYTLVGAGTKSRYSQAVPTQFGTGPTTTQTRGYSSFGGVTHTAGYIQSYLNKGQWTAPEREQIWVLDLSHYNPSLGSGGEGASPAWAQTYSLVSGKTQTYLIDVDGGLTSGKIFPFIVFAGRYILQDMSGPGSVIGDANAWKYCVAYANNECVTGSTAGQVFVNVPQAASAATCMTNQHAENYPCLTNGSWMGAWVTQGDISRDDPYARYSRRLTMAFTGPGRQYQFKNIHTSPNGQWGFVESGWIDGVRDDMLLVKMPPWPGEDTAVRGDFVSVPVSLGGATATKARIKFGYTPDFYCTSRAEACVTDTVVTPFAYIASDGLTPVACASGCTISIPVIAGRVLYYQVERLNDAGALLAQSEAQAVAVP